MSAIDEISEAIGGLKAEVTALNKNVEKLTDIVEGLQKTRWTAKGVMAGIGLAGGAVGGKIAALFGGSPPTPPFHP